MSNATIIKTATNEAYWNAARVMCSRCASLNDPERQGDEWVHILARHAGEDWVGYECYAGPIHALIEKLNQGEE